MVPDDRPKGLSNKSFFPDLTTKEVAAPPLRKARKVFLQFFLLQMSYLSYWEIVKNKCALMTITLLPSTSLLHHYHITCSRSTCDHNALPIPFFSKVIVSQSPTWALPLLYSVQLIPSDTTQEVLFLDLTSIPALSGPSSESLPIFAFSHSYFLAYFFLPALPRYNGQIKFFIFKMYSVMFWYVYILWNDYYD